MDDTKNHAKGWLFTARMLRAPLPALDLLGCAVLLVAFAVYFHSADALPAPFNKMDIGPAGFPVLLAAAGLIAVLCVAVAAVVRVLDAVPVEWIAMRRPLAVAFAAGLMIVESIWFEQIGTIPCVIVFALGTMLACGERRIPHLVGAPLALALFIYGVFVFALQVHLP